jgi:hypothetical protein
MDAGKEARPSMTDTPTLQDCITALGSTLYQLDGMSQADVCDIAGQLADLADLVIRVADGRDAAIDRMLRMDAAKSVRR